MSGISPTFSSSLKAFFPTDSASEHSILQEALYKWLDMKWYILQQAQKLHACLLILEVKLSQVLLCAYANAENNVTDDLFQMDSMELLKYFCTLSHVCTSDQWKICSRFIILSIGAFIDID